MDGDEVRRGGPTAHVTLGRAFGGAHVGAALAVLAGDSASAEAHRVVAELAAPAEIRVRDVAVIFVRMHGEVVLGQAIDLTLGADDEAAVERMHDLKTGSYTVRGPVARAALADASADLRAALDAWARPLGVAFQLRDDLRAFGEPSQTGKPVGSDLRAKKRTALIAAAHRLARGDDARELERRCSRPRRPSATRRSSEGSRSSSGAARARRSSAPSTAISSPPTPPWRRPSSAPGRALLGDCATAGREEQLMARASAKVILFGEHAVVYGRLAVAAALDRGAQATATLGAARSVLELEPWQRVSYADDADDEVGRAYAAVLEVRRARGGAHAGVGRRAGGWLRLLGGHRRLGRARDRHARGEALDDAEVARRATAWERVFHGNPSGVDGVAIAARGGVIAFKKGEPPRPLHPTFEVPIAVAFTGECRRPVPRSITWRGCSRGDRRWSSGASTASTRSPTRAPARLRAAPGTSSGGSWI